MKKCLVSILIIVGITIQCQNVYADDNVISFKKVSEEHRTRSSPVGISVNSKGEIALGFNDKYINVYDSNGKFINGYTLNTSGSYEFKYDDEDNIMIYSERSGRCYFFNIDAKLVNTREFSNWSEADRYLRSIENNTKVVFNGNLYELRDTLGYTKLTKTDANGNITIIYETGWDYVVTIIGRVIVLLFFISLLLAFKNFRK